MRGRDAMEERTLSNLCNSFHEFVFAFKNNLRNILTENDTTIMKVFYIRTLNMVDVRTENGKRALAKFTVLYNATLERKYLDINFRNSRKNITPS